MVITAAKTPMSNRDLKSKASHSDGIIYGSAVIPEEIIEFCKKAGLPALEYRKESFEDGSYIEDYNNFYDQL